ncbi:hypothetical protein [Flavobacterium sp. YO64]|uniref:hypothetical protein n=1 Tax=Flavobacterium sp. YO64 TaxID=394559 RepID=UPI00100AB0FB|nr:hypothetical protein [Flavobacterium sp. YO64]RXM42102.1 hypothetical protein BOW57_17840 [Flavobacterium sp. YO64]
MGILKKITFISLIFLIFINCKNKEEKIIASQKRNELIFKNWLRDTINTLNKENHLDYKRKINISVDSLSMDIVKTFDEKISPEKINKIKNKELIYAMDLLSRNHYLPEDEFKLKFVINSYYSISMVGQLKYEYDSKIKQFDVIKKSKIEKYTFLKGNFIEKKILNY